MGLDVLVIGAGGNGQTYFMEFLQANGIKTNKLDDSDKLKHMVTPNLIKADNSISKCIFIYNKPYEAIQSHYRREWHFIQLKKLGNPYQFKENQIDNLDKYNKLVIQNKFDLFGIEYQFFNWHKAKLDFPILFLDFNEILSQQHIINAFCKKELNYSIFKMNDRICRDSNNPIIKKIYNNLYYYIKEKSRICNQEIIQKIESKYKNEL